MTRVALAKQLQLAGLSWSPVAGDRFVVDTFGPDAEVFVISNMVIEVQDLPGGRVLGFNGTTEWALDSLELQDVVWLPREDQLRSLLGDSFRRLEAGPDGFVVVLSVGTREQRHGGTDAEEAYARALLTALQA